MYTEHFGLSDTPFSIAPDPRYLYLSGAHREALAHLLYGVRGDGGFVLLTGEVGTGKTTVCRCLLEQLPEQTQAALILNPALTVTELLASVCDDLGVAYPDGNLSNKVFIDALNRFLLDAHSRGMTTLLIVDEAQNLSAEVLEQLRLLTNLETASRKLLQIILIGQPELRDLLARNDMRQIAQRVTARYHLGSLDRAGTGAYLKHRLSVAGARRRLFSESAVAVLHRRSRGIPRLLNVIADRALLGAYSRGRTRVDARTARRAAAEVLAETRRGGRKAILAALASAAAVLILLAWLPEGPWEQIFDQGKLPGRKAEAVSTAAAGEWLQAVESADSGSLDGEGALLRLWGVEPARDGLCREAAREGLACLSGVASLSLLESLDRPALLELQAPSGKTFQALLTSLEENTAKVRIGEWSLRVPAHTLTRYWLGGFTLLWRPTLPSVTTLGRGATGDGVAWLDRALPSLTGLKEGETSYEVADTYDLRLENRVKRFQLRHGLLLDGIAGPKTLIMLNRIQGAPGPRLTPSTREA